MKQETKKARKKRKSKTQGKARTEQQQQLKARKSKGKNKHKIKRVKTHKARTTIHNANKSIKKEWTKNMNINT